MSKEKAHNVPSYDSGRVISVKHNIVEVNGLYEAAFHTLVYIGKDAIKGLIIHLAVDRVVCSLLESGSSIKEGDLVKSSNEYLKVPVGPNLIGRLINPLGQPTDGLPLGDTEYSSPYKRCCPLMERSKVRVPLITGIKAIDYLFPIGRGQRELIVGNRGTGKTQLALDAIIAQRSTDVKCVMVMIGQPLIKVNRVIQTLKDHDCLRYTTVVYSLSSDLPTWTLLAPFTGCAIAEYFMERGQDTLVVYDDMQKFAWAHRNISLTLNEAPGRESYSGTLFSTMAQLLERAACVSSYYIEKCSNTLGSKTGSLTALPIMEIQEDDITSYVCTSLISIVDGQIVLNETKMQKNIMPAVDIGVSVSRVGGDARTQLMSKYVGDLKYSLSQYEDARSTSVLDDLCANPAFADGERAIELLKQEPNNPLSYNDLILSLAVFRSDTGKQVPLVNFRHFCTFFCQYVKREYASFYELLSTMDSKDSDSGQVQRMLVEAFVEYQSQ